MPVPLVRPVAASAVARELGLSLEAGDDLEIRSVAPLSDLEPHALTFIARTSSVAIPSSVLVLSPIRPQGQATWIAAERARLAFVKALRWLQAEVGFAAAMTESAIHPTVKVGSGSSIGRARIGEGTLIGHNVRIADGVSIGKHCVIKSGSVIGEDGFGFERDSDGTPLRMPHLGGVVIGDRVEIGSLNTVCRGALSSTIIEDDVKTDDHVHVAHNCRIKRKALLTACAELSGGVTVGEEAWIGPNASIIDNVQIGDRALVGLGAVVIREVPAGVTVAGSPARVLERKS